MLEANPRASRTVPFVSKATATPLAKAAARVMLGTTIAELRAEGLLRAIGDGSNEHVRSPIAVKEAVMPFNRFRTVEGISVDTILGPEMKSTGEVMGLDMHLRDRLRQEPGGRLRAAADQGHGLRLGGQPGQAVRDLPGQAAGRSRLRDPGHRRHRIDAAPARGRGDDRPQVQPGPGPDGEKTIVQVILDGEVDLIFNTPHGLSPDGRPRFDGYEIRTAAVLRNIPCVTTVQGLAAAVQGIEAIMAGNVGVRSLQSSAWPELALTGASGQQAAVAGRRLRTGQSSSVTGGSYGRHCSAPTGAMLNEYTSRR